MTNPQSVEEKFQQFDFSTSNEWQNYINNLFPTPTCEQFIKIKRKWYKNHIDTNLELEEVKEEVKQQQENQQQQKQQPQQQQGQPGEQMPKWVYGIYKIEGMLKMLFFPLYFLLPKYNTMVIVIICLLALLRQLRFPKFNREYGRALFTNEFFFNILFLVPFALEPRSSFFFYLPIFVHFWIGTAEFIYRQQFFFYRYIASVIEQTRTNRNQLIHMKSKLEINLLLILTVMVITKQFSIIGIFLYANFLRMKYMANTTMQFAFIEIDTWINGITHHRYCPSGIAWIYSKIRVLCGYLVKTPQQ